MLNGNLILLLLSVVAVFALGMDSKNKQFIKEGYAGGMPQLATYIEPIDATTMTDVKSSVIRNASIYGSGITNATVPRLGQDMKGQFVTTPAYQTNIAPRFFPGQMPSSIAYAMPSMDNMAFDPKNPKGYAGSLPGSRASASDFGAMACKEGYIKEGLSAEALGRAVGAAAATQQRESSRTQQKPPQPGKKAGEGYQGPTPSQPSYCGASAYGQVLPPNYKANQGQYNQLADQLNKVTLTDFTPSMDMTTITSTGDEEQVRIINRYVYANKKDRQLSGADPIRGDLPIVPCNNGWFNVSSNPVTMLNPGAMAVMGGTPSDYTPANLWRLQNAASGNSGQFSTSIAGLGFDPTGAASKMTLQKSIGIDPAEGVNVATLYGTPAVSNPNPKFQLTSFP